MRYCVVTILRYCVMIALALVVGFMTGAFIEVVYLKATGGDVFFGRLPVTPRYHVADRAEMTGQAVAQITQPPRPHPAETIQPPRSDPASTKERHALLAAYVDCLSRSAEKLDDGKSDADTIAREMISSCRSEFDAYVAYVEAHSPHLHDRLVNSFHLFGFFGDAESLAKFLIRQVRPIREEPRPTSLAPARLLPEPLFPDDPTGREPARIFDPDVRPRPDIG